MIAIPKKLSRISPKSKYRNVPTVVDGIRFSSSAEAGRYVFLSALQKSGEISDLRLQVTFVVAPSVRLIGSKRKTPELRYVADFTYRNASGRLVVEDVKGAITPVYKIKRHLLALQGIYIHEIKS